MVGYDFANEVDCDRAQEKTAYAVAVNARNGEKLKIFLEIQEQDR